MPSTPTVRRRGARLRRTAGRLAAGAAVLLAAHVVQTTVAWPTPVGDAPGSAARAEPAPRGPAAPLTTDALLEAPVARATAATGPPPADLPGWQQVFSEDFTEPLAVGGWSGSGYADRWLAYDGFADTTGTGLYDPHSTVSSDGEVLDLHFRTVDGRPRVAGIAPLVGGEWGGQVHGRWSVRFRAESTGGYGAALLVWPDSDDWSEGEIDFAEGELDATLSAYHHCLGEDPSVNCAWSETAAPWSQWHVATVEWTASGVRYLLDGQELISTPLSPTAPMHLVIQGSAAPGAPADAEAHLQVDWVSVWAPAPA